jgi:hypothetical protein
MPSPTLLQRLKERKLVQRAVGWRPSGSTGKDQMSKIFWNKFRTEPSKPE